MIDKLYKLKQQQINQQILQKQLIVAKIDDIDKELGLTHHNIHSVGIDVIGAISDFRILEIHKNTMKEHIIKLNRQKEELKKQLLMYDKKILELNKESEQFNYILQEQKKELLKEITKQEELVTSEYVQAKFFAESKKYVS